MQGAQRRAVKIIALRANARRIIEPRSGAVANRQARERLITNEIQIEPRL